jgi:hypothetical protein
MITDDIKGKHFGRLVVLNLFRRNKRTWSVVKCDCGKIKEVLVSSLNRDKGTKSCGCLQSEIAKLNKGGIVKHGMCGSPIYHAWSAMIQRCTNNNSPYYKNYGGRGIKVCDRWLKFENFHDDMKDKPSKKLTLERIDNEKGYFKENCRWATMQEQSRNKRNTQIGASGLEGVYIRANKFSSNIYYQNKKYTIGTFRTKELASLAYQSCKWVLKNSTEVLNGK